MGRIGNLALRALAETWTPVVFEVLDELGKRTWPPVKERQGLLSRPNLIVRYSLEGPAQRDDEIVWALSHTSRPSAFNDEGKLTEGERHYWLVYLQEGEPLTFRVEGKRMVDGIPANQQALKKAIEEADDYPIIEAFYGNKGPLRHWK